MYIHITWLYCKHIISYTTYATYAYDIQFIYDSPCKTHHFWNLKVGHLGFFGPRHRQHLSKEGHKKCEDGHSAMLASVISHVAVVTVIGIRAQLWNSQVQLVILICIDMWDIEKRLNHFSKGGGCCERHFFFAFLKVHVCKRYQALFFPKPNTVASATKATTVHSQQLSHILHRYINIYIDLAKTNMNENKTTKQTRGNSFAKSAAFL